MGIKDDGHSKPMTVTGTYLSVSPYAARAIYPSRGECKRRAASSGDRSLPRLLRSYIEDFHGMLKSINSVK